MFFVKSSPSATISRRDFDASRLRFAVRLLVNSDYSLGYRSLFNLYSYGVRLGIVITRGGRGGEGFNL